MKAVRRIAEVRCVVRSIDTGDFRVHEIVHPPDTVLIDHEHPLAQISSVLAGRFHEIVEGCRRTYLAGTTVLRPPGSLHRNLGARGESRALVIELAAETFQRFARLFPSGPVPVEVGPEVTRGLVEELVRELEVEDAASVLAVRGLVFQLLARLGRVATGAPPEPEPDWFLRTRQLLAASYRQPLSLRDLAAAVGVHPARLAREFRRHVGCSVGEQIRTLRMAYATDALVSRRESIADIATRSGFVDQAHFSREFKKRTGRTPTEFRASLGPATAKSR
jgi:AraC family transcriptional regulator